MPDAAARPRPFALTMGDPAGIGGEIAVKAWRRRARLELPEFFLLDDPARIAGIARQLNIEAPIREVDGPAAAAGCFDTALPVLPVRLAKAAVAGKPSPDAAPAVLRSIELAVTLALAGEAGGVVTNPVGKAVLATAGFKHAGHTQYLGELCGPGHRPVMMFVCSTLRTVPLTVHCALYEAVRRISADLLRHTAQTIAQALEIDFGVSRPRIAVAGLNPHAGEGGLLGREELEVIGPALERLRAEGLNLIGPLPGDALFTEKSRQHYDAALCMYHDQALIPIKTIDFEHGVNVTLGLPIIRTSPDHGTAYDIAGTGAAQATSLVAALWLANDIARRRQRARAAG